MKTRFDPNYQINILKFREAIKKANYHNIRLRKIVENIQYGSSSLASEEPIGLPIIRMANMQNDEWDFSKLKYVQLTEREQLSYRLNKGDILFNRTNSKELVGKCNVFQEEGHWLFASYLMRVVIDRSKALPEFVSIFLGTDVGRLQINAVSRQIAGMTNINSEEIRDLEVILPEMSVQEKVKGYYEQAQNVKRQQEAQAQTLLDSIDGYLLSELGITLPPESDNTIENRVFKTSWRQVSGGRFDPISSSKERVNAINAIQSSKYPQKRLHNVAHFPKILLNDNPTSLPYVGLENIESNTGFYLETSEKESFGSAIYFRKGEVLFPKLRPYLNKVHFADFEGLCSTEFVILNAHSCLDNQFLAEFLRSKAVLSQTKYLSSGNTLPRLQTEDTRRLLIPIPPLNVQKRIVQHINAIRQQAQTLRQQAQDDFAKAKQEIEQMILG